MHRWLAHMHTHIRSLHWCVAYPQVSHPRKDSICARPPSCIANAPAPRHKKHQRCSCLQTRIDVLRLRTCAAQPACAQPATTSAPPSSPAAGRRTPRTPLQTRPPAPPRSCALLRARRMPSHWPPHPASAPQVTIVRGIEHVRLRNYLIMSACAITQNAHWRGHVKHIAVAWCRFRHIRKHRAQAEA